MSGLGNGSHADGLPTGTTAADVERANREVIDPIDYGEDNSFGCEQRRAARRATRDAAHPHHLENDERNANIPEPLRSIVNSYYAAAVPKEIK